MGLDGHIAVFQHSLDRDGIAVFLDFGGVGDLGQMELFGNLRANLGRVAVDGLPSAEDHVILFHADGVDGGGDNLAGGVGVGTAELAGGDKIRLIRAHGQRFPEHSGGGGGAHGDDDHFAARLVLDFQGGFQRVHVVGVGDGLHGGAVQGSVLIDGDFAGGIGNLLDGNNDFHNIPSASSYFTPRRLAMTMRWTSDVPS